MRIARRALRGAPGRDRRAPTSSIRMPALLFLAVHRGEANPVVGPPHAAASGSPGSRRLFLLFPRLFPTEASASWLARSAFLARRAWRRRGAGAARAEREAARGGARLPPASYSQTFPSAVGSTTR